MPEQFTRSLPLERISEPEDKLLADQAFALLTNYQKLVARTVDVFGDEIKASRWLSLPNPELNGETPLQTAQRHGYSSVALEPIFTRIEHGIDY